MDEAKTDFPVQWENLTSLDFSRAVVACAGVGIIPIGVLEPHASHLPLGTDMFVAHWVACQAAEREPAIVFPVYPYSINVESAHLPGSLVIHHELAAALLENICDEMARHGLTKIILLSGHGGNRFFLPLFVQTLPEKDKRYLVYYADLPHFSGVDELLEGQEFGHACEAETSMLQHIAAHLVRLGQRPPQPFSNLERNRGLQAAGAYSPLDWYAQYPSMYVGDAGPAASEKGRVILEHRVSALLKLIRAVKADQVTPGLLEEFLERKAAPRPPDSWHS